MSESKGSKRKSLSKNKINISKEQYNNLKEFIENLLRNFLNLDISPLVSKRAMPKWVRAFTTELVNFYTNYESSEFLGDGILKGVFIAYLVKRNPKYTVMEYTEINRTYMSKLNQAKFAEDLGLLSYIIHVGKVDANISGDIFESFIGTLYSNSEEFLNPGMGFVVCYKFIEYLFKNIHISRDIGKGHPKTRVLEIFKSFGYSAPATKYSNEADKLTIYLSDEFINDVDAAFKFKPEPEYIGSGSTKSEASNNAYKSLLSTFETNNAGSEQIRRMKFNKDMSTPALEQYADKLKAKLELNGYSNPGFYFPPKFNTKINVVCILLSIDNNKQQFIDQVIMTRSRNTKNDDQNKAKLQLVRKVLDLPIENA
jgi:dsRNA-specific ribonuclease